MFTLPLNPSNPSVIIESSFSLYKTSFKHVFGFSLLAVFCFLLPIYWPYFISTTNKVAFTNKLSVNYLLFSISWIMSLLLTIGLLFNLHCFCYGIKNSPLQVVRHSLSRTITTLLTVMLYLVIVLSGTMLLIVPGFIFSISLMFAFLMVINENKGVLQSLMASHQLVWGIWWHTFVVMSVPLLLNLVVMLFCFVMLASIFPASLSDSQLYLIPFSMQLILQSLLLPFSLSVAIVLFNDLRIRQQLTKSPY